MVRSARVALALMLAAAACAPEAAHARTLPPQAGPVAVDWRPAGGDLFAVDPPAPDPAFGTAGPTVRDPDPARLTDPGQPFGAAIAEAAHRHGLDPKLLHALVVVESAYRSGVCSPAGACGLTQLMPATARELGVRNRFEPTQNLRGGADYLARQLLRFGDVRLALAAYNAGPGRVARLGRIPDIAETRAYVTAVIDCYLALAAGRGIRSARDCRPGGGR